MEILNHEIDYSSVRAYVIPPTGIQQSVKLGPNGQGSYVPDKSGMHEIQIEVNEDKYVYTFFQSKNYFLTIFFLFVDWVVTFSVCYHDLCKLHRLECLHVRLAV